MRFAKFVRNKDIFQLMISIILIACVFLLQTSAFSSLFSIETDEQAITQFNEFSQNANYMGQYFLVVNPSSTMLANPFSGQAILAFLQLILYNGIAMVVFVVIGRVTYLKDIVRNLVTYTKKKKKTIKVEKETKSRKIGKSYLQKEWKMLRRQPIFFMQCIFPVIFVLVTAIVLVFVLLPILSEIAQDQEMQEILKNTSFDTEVMSVILQILFSLSSLSLTAISREGKNATFMKQIPISLYRQFVYKSIPQIVLNTVVTIVVIGLIWYLVPSISNIYLLLVEIIAMLMNGINSYLMLIVDLRRPNLDWDTEYSVVKKSDNKIFQYAFLIISVLVLMYFGNVFDNVDILFALLSEIAVFAVLFITIDRCVKKWQSKLFNKIN